MGLDMYLEGKVHFLGRTFEPLEKIAEVFDLGYWRKHPNLHGFIVNTFADGVDDQKPIHLNEDRLNQIIQAIKQRELPTTTGFFFGTSDDSPEQIKNDLMIFTEALKWLKAEDQNGVRSIYYSAWW